MAIHLELVDHDDLFNKATTPPIIVNGFDLQSQVHMAHLNELIYTTYDGDSLEVLPHCDCGKTKGVYNTGVRCPECGTKCLSVTERPFESVLWIEPPEGVVTLINPHVWIILNERFRSGNVSILEWLTNPTMQIPTDKEPDAIKKLIKAGMHKKRGLNYFYHHFDEIVDLLLNGKVIIKDSPADRQELLDFIARSRDKIFCQHLPIPSKLALITEKTPMGTYADASMRPAVDAVRTISSIENSVLPLSIRKRESRTTKAIMQLAEYFADFYYNSMRPKEGWPRKHLFGARIHFSARGVISSISDAHHDKEVHLPWSMSVMLYKLHLINKLLRRGYTPNQANQHIYEHTLKYSIVLDEIFQELIAEGPFFQNIVKTTSQTGLPILVQRNPTLTRGSIQQLFAALIKTDPGDNTIGVPTPILDAWNADFDGDQLNVAVVPDMRTYERVSRHQPHLYAMDLNKPHHLSGYLALPSPIVATLSAWVHADTQ